MRVALAALLGLGLAGCLGTTPERAEILGVRVLDGAGSRELEVTQRLQLSRRMLGALSAGIPLRLVYRIEPCGRAGPVLSGRIDLRYSALTRRYELRGHDGERRLFARRAALLAALDRVRLPLAGAADADCTGRLQVALDLTSLPTPLRFPAFLQPEDWRLVSPAVSWNSARD